MARSGYGRVFLLTLRRGVEIVPVAEEIIRFWVTRLHGPEALYKDLFSGVARAAAFLTAGNEAKAQNALDSLGLFDLSRDGAALMKAVAHELAFDLVNLPVRDGPRKWNAQDIMSVSSRSSPVVWLEINLFSCAKAATLRSSYFMGIDIRDTAERCTLGALFFSQG
jgi:hypothetical protein